MVLDNFCIILHINLSYRSRRAHDVYLAKNKQTKRYATYSKFGDIPVNVRIFTNVSEAFEDVEHRIVQEYRNFAFI